MSMSGYTKLFNSILASTIWREDNITRIVWITLLAMADKDGIAEGSIPGLATFAHVSVKDAERAIAKLSSPDEWSRSQEHDGRRIKAVDGGWQLLNHAKYRAKLNSDERREYNRVKKAESRQKKSAKVKKVNDASALSAQAEAEATSDTDTKTEEQKQKSAPLIMSPAAYERRKAHCFFVGSRLEVPNALHADLRKLLGGPDPDQVLESWYLALNTEIEETGEAIVPDVFRWVRARFALWPKPKGKTVTDEIDEWARS